MRIAVLAALGALLSMPALAQPAPDRVSMKYSTETAEAAPVPLSGACAVTLHAVNDQRPNKETVGYDFKPLLSGDGAAWSADALRNLKAYGFSVREAGQPAELGMEATLIRAYTWTASLRINAMVAMNVDYVMPSGARSTVRYRAYGSKTNVWAATDEFMTTMNYAMNNLLAKVATDLQKRCGSRT